MAREPALRQQIGFSDWLLGSSYSIPVICVCSFFVCFRFFVFHAPNTVSCIRCKSAQTWAEAAMRCSRIPETLPVTTVCRLLSLFAVCLSCLSRETSVTGSRGGAMQTATADALSSTSHGRIKSSRKLVVLPPVKEEKKGKYTPLWALF